MKNKLFTFLSLTIVFFACTKNTEIPVNENNLLLGNWINAIYDNNKKTVTFERAENLKKEAYGVSFKEKNIFVQRTSGWCGTPPLTFFDEKGTFKVTKDLIEVKIKNFPGNFNWRIITLTNNKLLVKRELNEQQKDRKKLTNLYNKISSLSKDKKCTNVNDWKFTAYGSKACGGPQGYITYSTKIDTTAFLQKVKEYTKAEKTYNKKWGIVSTCDITQKPKSVECKNGYPVLKY